MRTTPFLPALLAGTLILALSASSATAASKCLDKVDVSDLSGPGSETIAELICDGTVGPPILESARAWDTVVDRFGNELRLADFESWEELQAQSAKMVEIHTPADRYLAFSMKKLREKLERYMTRTYQGLFRHAAVPLIQVRILATSEMSDGNRAVVYGTSIRNEGVYGPGNLPTRWETWRLHRDFR